MWAAKFSTCPSHAWLPRVIPHVLKEGDPNRVTFLNVGANKGYDLLSFLQWYTDTNWTMPAWKRLLEDDTAGNSVCVDQCCGVCGSCNHKRPRGTPYARPRHVELHAFEPAASTRALLQRVVAATRIPATVYALAVGNSSTAPVLVEHRQAGYEGSSPVPTSTLPPRAAARQSSKRAVVNQTTLDDFVAEHRIKYAHHVLIDAEGWDGMVLAGMRTMLSSHACGLVGFEFSTKWHGVHPAKTRSLEAAVHWMASFGYKCYWQSNYGALASATPPCWRDLFAHVHPLSWRNLICAASPSIIQVLDENERENDNKTAARAAVWFAKQLEDGKFPSPGGGTNKKQQQQQQQQQQQHGAGGKRREGKPQGGRI